MEMDRRAGFLPGMTQPSQYLTFDIEHRKEVDFDQLEKRQVEIFGTEPVPCNKSGVSVPGSDVQLVWRTLLVSRDILQAGGAPIFDPGLILTIKKVPGNDTARRARCLFPIIPHIPGAYIREAVRLALLVISLLAKTTPDRKALDDLLEKIHQNFIYVARRTIGGGESTVQVIQAAYERRIPFTHLGQSIYRLGWGQHSRLVDRSAIESDAMIGARLTQNKFMTSRVLRSAGIPASRHIMVGSWTQALKAAESIGWPVVVKPADKDRGEGVSVDIDDPQALQEAYENAVAVSREVLVEEQVPGVCHRIFVAGQRKVIFVTQRLPKSVKGDGKHTVGELIDQANETEKKKAPWRRLKPFPVDQPARKCLAGAGLTLDSIPAEGQYAPLRRIQSNAEGGVTEDRTPDVHPENVDIALRAAALFGLDSAGIDLITEDISRPWYENGAIINEVNYAPLLGGHRTEARAKDYPGKYLDLVIHEKGRLPVEVYVGGDSAMAAALKRQQRMVEDGIRCHVASHNTSLRPDGSIIWGDESGLFGRTLQLVGDKTVEALILVVQTNELLYTGCPIDGLGAIHDTESDIIDWRQPSQKASSSSRHRLVSLLSEFSRPIRPVIGR